MEDNPFDEAFSATPVSDDEDDSYSDDSDLGFSPSDSDVEASANFAVLNSSLPPSEHHLTTYASAKRSAGREKRHHRTKWHFGIRSRSPPMEIMLEIYKVLKELGMEWKEKQSLGGLAGVSTRPGKGGVGIERVKDLDGGGTVDQKAAAGIYFIETRARAHNVVVSTRDAFPLWTILMVNTGPDEPTAVYGRLHQFPGRFSPQKDVQSVNPAWCGEV